MPTLRWGPCAAVAVLMALALPTTTTRADDEAALPAPATLRVLSARVRPLRPDGQPWDGDHQKVPRLVYEVGGRFAGLPGLGLLAAIPYRNRPDPRLEVRQGDGDVLARHRALQGTFLPTWLLTAEPRVGPGHASVVTFELVDDDLRDDDRIGKAMLDLDAALARPGVHVLEGTGGLHDLTIVVRNPALHPQSASHTVLLQDVLVTAREQRPAGGDWDAGANPLRDTMRRLPHADKLQGLQSAKPDLHVVLVWSDGDARDLGAAKDTFAHGKEGLGWSVTGREGIGDGLFVRAYDEDSVLDDPVGVAFVPLGRFLEAREAGKLTIETDESNGIARIDLAFTLPE